MDGVLFHMIYAKMLRLVFLYRDYYESGPFRLGCFIASIVNILYIYVFSDSCALGHGPYSVQYNRRVLFDVTSIQCLVKPLQPK